MKPMESIPIEIIHRIQAQHGIGEHFIDRETSGLANYLYMSEHYVLRIPTDHEEAQNDAYTEAVAAPRAYEQGIATPYLVVFNDERNILPKSYSIWERIDGVSLDNYSGSSSVNCWISVGKELAAVHSRITTCEDPQERLDTPDRDYTKEGLEKALKALPRPSKLLERIVETHYTTDTFTYEKRFVHGDIHEGNILIREPDTFLSLIDWGDAGWADPAIDFYLISPHWITYALWGYSQVVSLRENPSFFKRIILDKIWQGLSQRTYVKGLEIEITHLLRDCASFCPSYTF